MKKYMTYEEKLDDMAERGIEDYDEYVEIIADEEEDASMRGFEDFYYGNKYGD